MNYSKNINGILLINKEKKYTSNDVVQKVKHLLNQKVGHTGTLDPNATGLLPLLIGKATLCSKYLIKHDKKYKVVLQLGIKTSTADIEGEVLETKKIDENIYKNIKDILNFFVGEQEQTPPIYSAIKVKGKKLYEYARKNQEVEIPKRQITIYDIQLLNINKQENQIEFEVYCSKGTYIRSICEDIAKKLGTVGYMKELERTKVGDFSLSDAIKINEIKELKMPYFITIEDFFKEKQSINLNNDELKNFLNGVKLAKKDSEGLYKIYSNNVFIGTGTIKNNLLKRDVII